jgi:hypothetical protein
MASTFDLKFTEEDLALQRTLTVNTLDGGKVVGHFTMSGTKLSEDSSYKIPGTRTVPVFDPSKVISLGIGLDDGYQKKGLSMPMIERMIECIGNIFLPIIIS